jgi:putative transposase
MNYFVANVSKMSTKYKTGDNEIAHFISFAVVNWIDALTRNEYKNIIVESLKYCMREKGMSLNAWIIMSNHVHLVMSAKKEFIISHILRDMKKFTSKRITEAISNNPKESRREWMLWMFERAGKKISSNDKYQFWQHDNHPIELTTQLMLKQRLDYLHQNPVRAGIVYEPQEYIYSSAIDYFTTKRGFIEIDHLQV